MPLFLKKFNVLFVNAVPEHPVSIRKKIFNGPCMRRSRPARSSFPIFINIYQNTIRTARLEECLLSYFPTAPLLHIVKHMSTGTRPHLTHTLEDREVLTLVKLHRHSLLTRKIKS